MSKEYSKSALEKFLRCGFAFDQHYNKKVRPILTGSALVMGIAIDTALNFLLVNQKITLKELIEYINQELAKYENHKIQVSRYDYDKDLIQDEDRKLILAYAKDRGYKGSLGEVDGLWNDLLNKEELKQKHLEVLGYMFKLSTIRKSEIILEEYRKQVLPKIKKVLSVQERVGPGVLDLFCEWEDNKKYVCDNKTTSSEYEDNAADYSVQLTDYAIRKKTSNIMFIVIPKKIDKDFTKTCKKCKHVANSSHATCNNEIDGKRCHGEWNIKKKFGIQIQFVKSKVTKLMKQRTLEIRESLKKTIEAGNFCCNFANCNNIFGKPCEYRELYWKNSMEGLEVKK